MTLAGRRVTLGVSGGIACYKACTIARRLTESGAQVDVVMTASACRFVGPVTFEALTGRPVLESLWQPGSSLEHVRLGRDVDMILVAPASANLIARAAAGIADDFLTTLLLAATVPVLLAPAMNDDMFAHPATQENLALLVGRGWSVVGPDTGPLAEGPSDRPGRMSEPEAVLAAAERAIRGRGPLAGKRVVVTAGPTREEMDPVRVVTNRSSGRMGYDLAAAAYARGADVLLISGPTNLPAPAGVPIQRVESTADLDRAVRSAMPDADVLVMAAAPSDFRPRERLAQKRPRADGIQMVELEPTPDILGGTRHLRRASAVVVGFALETGDGVTRARAKLERKGLDLIVLNLANEVGAGFESSTNRVTLVGTDTAEELPLLPKPDVAEKIFDIIEKRL